MNRRGLPLRNGRDGRKRRRGSGECGRHDLPGLGAPNGHGGRIMLPESQQPLQRPPCLPLWAGHRRFEQSSWVHLTRSAVAPQLTHAGSIAFIYSVGCRMA
jgi:hypothetical protein